MRDFQSQIFTVFGGAYIGEDHGAAQLPLHPTKDGQGHRVAKAAVVIGLLALGLTTATAMKAPRLFGGPWAHHPHATWMVTGFEEALY
jgi:hypothetical protein